MAPIDLEIVIKVAGAAADPGDLCQGWVLGCQASASLRLCSTAAVVGRSTANAAVIGDGSVCWYSGCDVSGKKLGKHVWAS